MSQQQPQATQNTRTEQNTQKKQNEAPPRPPCFSIDPFEKELHLNTPMTAKDQLVWKFNRKTRKYEKHGWKKYRIRSAVRPTLQKMLKRFKGFTKSGSCPAMPSQPTFLKLSMLLLLLIIPCSILGYLIYDNFDFTNLEIYYLGLVMASPLLIFIMFFAWVYCDYTAILKYREQVIRDYFDGLNYHRLLPVGLELRVGKYGTWMSVYIHDPASKLAHFLSGIKIYRAFEKKKAKASDPRLGWFSASKSPCSSSRELTHFLTKNRERVFLSGEIQ